MKSKDLSILVYSCHRNSDMWTVFTDLFKKYWPDCVYKLILLTDKEEDNYSSFDEHVVLDGSWYEMLMAGIDEANTPYVMLFMDDYLMCNLVNNADIEQYIEYAKKYNAANIRLHTSEVMKRKTFRRDDRFDFYRPGQAESFSTQVGIWDVSFLRKYIKPEWSAWDFERKGSVEVCDKIQPLLGAKDYEFPYIEGVRKGKWMIPGYEMCRRAGIKPDLKKRPLMTNFDMAWIYFKGGILGLNPNLVQKIQNCVNRVKK